MVIWAIYLEKKKKKIFNESEFKLVVNVLDSFSLGITYYEGKS